MEKTTLTITTASPEEATMLIEILSEVSRARAKHPVWPADPVKRSAILSEECGEVVREANHIDEGRGDYRALRSELIQTAGVCIRMLGLMDAERVTGRPVSSAVRSTYPHTLDQ